MKKIKMKHDNKDRIICISMYGKHSIYYQPIHTKSRFWLFDVDKYSKSLLVFFRKRGRYLDAQGYSVTVKELYQLGNVSNMKIRKILHRIPAQIEYVLREDAF